MCGIAGLWRPGGQASAISRQVAAMAASIAHRGPDSDGLWTDEVAGLSLGHRRLSIVDLSSAGAQPMAHGRYVLVFNGEIYNAPMLRRQLEESGLGYAWRGHSDTEVLLLALATWGIERTLQRLDGMFAFALWDGAERRLHLAVDRFGEKPLYCALHDGGFLFASELRAIRIAAPTHSLDLTSVEWLLQNSYIPAPRTIFADVVRLRPGQFVTLTEKDVLQGRIPEPKTYWSAGDAALEAQDRPFRGDLRDAEDRLHELLIDVVKSRTIADVRMGSMLSSGIDSATITAICQSLHGAAIKTCTIGFQDEAYNEADKAELIARHLGTDHTTIHVTESEILRAIPAMSSVYDEPFADSSQVVSTILSRGLREHVTVALSGDGGDEIFGGYNRYLYAPRVWALLSKLPAPLRAQFQRAISRPDAPDYGGWLAQLLQRRGEGSGRLQKALTLADSGSPDELFQRLLRNWPPDVRLTSQPGSLEYLAPTPDEDGAMSPLRRMMIHDIYNYLPGDILTKVDRAAMSVSLETRAPFLSPEIFGFAWSLPDDYLISGGMQKVVLQNVLRRYLPEDLIAGSKRGFAIPLDRWLRGPLREWASDLLDPRSLRDAGIYESPGEITALWQQHRDGRQAASRLWPVLMLEAWRRAAPPQEAAADIAPSIRMDTAQMAPAPCLPQPRSDERRNIRVLCMTVSPPNTAPSARFRCEAYFPLLRRHGVDVHQRSFFTAEEYSALPRDNPALLAAVVARCFARALVDLPRKQDYDAVWLSREAAPVGPAIIERLFNGLNGLPVVYDIDDAIWLAPEAESTPEKLLRHRSKIHRLVGNAASVIAGNEFLAQYARGFNTDVITVPTSVDVNGPYKRQKVHAPRSWPVVGWTGSRSTNRYLGLLSRPLSMLGDEVQFRLGVISDVEPHPPLKHQQFHWWSPWDEIENLLDFDVGVMPLLDSDWERGKCGFKIIQYMALGIPPIASDVGVNGQIIRHGVDGFLCRSDEDWARYLKLLLADHEMRAEFGRKGRERIVQSYSVQAHVSTLARVFREAAARHAVATEPATIAE